jgi:hypothetical protein
MLFLVSAYQGSCDPANHISEPSSFIVVCLAEASPDYFLNCKFIWFDACPVYEKSHACEHLLVLFDMRTEVSA